MSPAYDLLLKLGLCPIIRQILCVSLESCDTNMSHIMHIHCIGISGVEINALVIGWSFIGGACHLVQSNTPIKMSFTLCCGRNSWTLCLEWMKQAKLIINYGFSWCTYYYLLQHWKVMARRQNKIIAACGIMQSWTKVQPTTQVPHQLKTAEKNHIQFTKLMLFR